MFTNFKWEKVFYYEQGEYFLWFCLCVHMCMCMCKCASGPLSQCTFVLKTQLALSAKVIEWSSAMLKTQLFISEKQKSKQTQPLISTHRSYCSSCCKWKHNELYWVWKKNNALDTRRPAGYNENELHCPWNETVFDWNWRWKMEETRSGSKGNYENKCHRIWEFNSDIKTKIKM